MKLISSFPNKHAAFTILSRFGVILHEEHHFPKELVFIVQEFLTESFYRKKFRSPFVDTIRYGSEHGSLSFLITLYHPSSNFNKYQVVHDEETLIQIEIQVFEKGMGPLHCWTTSNFRHRAPIIYWDRTVMALPSSILHRNL